MPVILKGARAEILPISAFDITEMLHPSQLLVEEQARCLFHKKIHSLWNRPKSLFLRIVQDVR
ncbi:hypothetical protein [Microcoleus sp. T2B6]|uniref:hypothetical protein n=1 Tax=Microcoleus sp. T2B6 TaxID=3055424 RepID=UPI002FCF22FD